MFKDLPLHIGVILFVKYAYVHMVARDDFALVQFKQFCLRISVVDAL